MENVLSNVVKSEGTRIMKHIGTLPPLQTPPRTPTITAASSQALASEIHIIYDALSELPDLSPGEKVNTLLTRLVNLCIVPYSHEFIAYFFSIEGIHSLCERMRPICATAEGELERFWAKKIIRESLTTEASPTQTQSLLTTFPYHRNYLDLSRLECAALSAFLPPSTTPQKIAFVGSGPLPLTSLCMIDIYPSVHVHNIDRDISALSLSQDLCERLGYSNRMSFMCANVGAESYVEDLTKWSDFQIVFLAALVGMDTTAKLAILEELVKKLRPGALVVARSAKGLREVLYPILDLGEDLGKIGLEMLVEVHPWTKVVNSVIVLRVKER